MPDELVLNVDGENYNGWSKLDFSHSIDSGVINARIDISGPWRTGNHRGIEEGQPAQLLLNDHLLLSGDVEDRLTDYDATDHSVSIVVKSNTADLSACTLPGRTFTNQTLFKIAQSLCRPFGVIVVDTAKANKPFNGEVVLNEGESPWSLLEQLARSRGVRLVPTIDGKLEIALAGLQRADTGLILGENIDGGSGTFSIGERFSVVNVIATLPDDGNLLAGDPVVIGEAFDAGVLRYRPLTIVSHDPLTKRECAERADWHVRTQAGRGKSIVYKRQGLTQDSGTPWAVNTRVEVVDEYARIDGEQLISEVRLSRSENGDQTELRVMPPEALERTKLPDPVKASEALL